MIDGRSKRPRVARDSDKLFLTGRTCKITWLDDEGPVGEYVVIFSNNAWLRLLEVATGKEFVSPASAVYRIENIVEPN